MSNNGKLFSGFVLLLGGFVFLGVLLLAGVLMFQFSKYKNAGLAGLQNAPQAVVAITAPQTLSQASEGSQVVVNTSSSGYEPLASTELWVDGVLMGVQAAPVGGLFNFNTTFLWSPGPAGEHTLIARTLDANGDEVMSAPVVVNITTHAPAEGADGGAPYESGPAGVLPASTGGGDGSAPAVDAPLPNESEAPAQVGLPSVSDWVVDITNTEPPVSPELTATLDGCMITLHLHDLSDNEEGFQLFRSVPAAPAWTEIASLNSQSATDWITHEDTMHGPTKASYYVAAVNGVGASKSDPVTIELTASDCLAAQNGQEVLTIEPVSFHIDAAVDQAYCYKSVGSVYWDRWPTDGFFLPGADGFDVQPYKLTFAVNSLDGEPLIEKLDLYVECWGWAAGKLTYLGDVHFTSTDLFDLGEQEQGGGIFTMDANFMWGKYDPYDKFLVAPPESADMPFIYAELVYGGTTCKDHLPQEFQNAWGALLFCAPFPGFSSYAGTDNAQPYLVWQLDDYCQNGSGADCQTMASLLALAEENEGNVFFSVLDQNDYIDHFSFIEAPFTSHVVTPLKCKGTRTYTVKMIYTDAANYVEGPQSNEVSIPCFVAPPITQAHLDVTFDSLTLNNVDDDDGPPEDVELYGYVEAVSSDGSHGMLKLGFWDDYYRRIFRCPDEGISFGGSVASTGTLGCPESAQDGTYSFAKMLLCESDTLYNCRLNNSEDTFFLENTNIIHLTASDGDSIVLMVVLNDFDTGSPNDGACFDIITTSSKTAQAWSDGIENFTLHQPTFTNGGCDVLGTISASP